MEGVLAVITTVAYDFAPKTWAYCNGQLLAIAQNQALFSLLGTTYGGNGINTFALPNMQGRCPVGTGQSTAGSNYTLGEMTGTETATLNINQIPAHVHNGAFTFTPRACDQAEDSTPVSNFPGQVANGYATTSTAGTAVTGPNIISKVIGTAGSNQPFEILTPYLTLNYVICIQGIFPSRN